MMRMPQPLQDELWPVEQPLPAILGQVGPSNIVGPQLHLMMIMMIIIIMIMLMMMIMVIIHDDDNDNDCDMRMDTSGPG